jgi:uncharacterized protein
MRILKSVPFTVLLILQCVAASAEPLPQVRLQIGLRYVHAEVAATPESRSTGLMHRTELGRNQGMLFIFENTSTQAMWMRNTLVPLSVAFLDEHGAVINVAEMLPLTETVHASSAPARYALEMNAGWFANAGVKPGDRVRGVPRAQP